MDKQHKIILLIVLLSSFITSIDGSIVITSLAKMESELGLSRSALAWVQSAYVLAFGGFLLMGGRLSDLLGRRRVMQAALIIFGLSSALVGAAGGDLLLVAARFAQGVGAALLAPTALALLMDTFEGRDRVRAVAWYSSVVGLGSSVGLMLGGFLASFISWRVGFYINVPITLVMFMLSLTALPAQTEEKRFSFDMGGTLLSVLGIFSLVYAIDGAPRPLPWALLALVLLGAFVLLESRVKSPLLPLSLFTNRIRLSGYLARVLFMCAMMGLWFFLSEFFQLVFHFTPMQAGLAFFPMSISLFTAALCVPRLIARWGNKRVLLLGVVSLLTGFFAMLFLDGSDSYLSAAVLPLLFLGMGQGLSVSPLTNLGIHEAGAQRAGAASGLVNAFHQIGGSLGLACMIQLGGGLPLEAAAHRAMITGFCFIVVMGIVVLSIPGTAVMGSEVQAQAH